MSRGVSRESTTAAPTSTVPGATSRPETVGFSRCPPPGLRVTESGLEHEIIELAV
jgi:hypothetical protein